MSTSKFNLESSANVILRCTSPAGGQTEIKCHDAVLRSRSGVFRGMLDQSDLADYDGHTISELREYFWDCEALLKWMYTSQYTVVNEQKEDWTDHLDNAKIAQKYGLPDLEATAIEKFEEYLDDKGPESVAEMLGQYKEWDYNSDAFEGTIFNLRERHRKTIVEDSKLAAATDDTELMAECFIFITNRPKEAVHCECCGTRGTLYMEEELTRCLDPERKCMWIEIENNEIGK